MSTWRRVGAGNKLGMGRRRIWSSVVSGASLVLMGGQLHLNEQTKSGQIENRFGQYSLSVPEPLPRRNDVPFF